MILEKTLRKLADLEGAFEDLYRYFASVYSDDPNAFQLFSRLAREEKSHKNIVRYQLNLVKKNPESFVNIHIDLGEVEALIRLSEKIILSKSIHQLKDALSIAIQCEASAAEQHFRTALAEANPQIRPVIESLGKADEAHTEQLRAFARQRGLTDEDSDP